jgi:hypothetical protein
VEQSIAAIDFCSRNRLDLHSSDESYHTEFTGPQWDELRTLLGDEYVSKNGHWFWFTLQEAKVEVTFPRLRARENYLNWGVKKLGDHILPREQGPGPAARGTEARGSDRAMLNPSFETLLDHSGRDLIQHLETNFYNRGKKHQEITITDQGIMVFPTTPQDHLATRFLPLNLEVRGRKKLLRVGLFLGPETMDPLCCQVFVQDPTYTILSGDLLSDVSLSQTDTQEITQDIELDENIQKIRLLINFDKGNPSILPHRIRIEQAIFR